MGQSSAHVEAPDEAAIRALFGVPAEALLGGGGEARVFAVDDVTVLRIFHPCPGSRPESADGLLAWWHRLEQQGADLGIALPVVLDSGRMGHQSWTLDRRVPGRSVMAHLRATPDEAPRRRTLLSMLDAVRRLRELPLPANLFGFRRLVQQPPRAFPDLASLLEDRMRVGLAGNGMELARRVPDLDHRHDWLLHRVRARCVPPAFVHNDFFPGNVLCGADGLVTGVCDIGAHALAADPVMDEVAAAALLDGYPGAEADSVWLSDVLRERLGPDAWLVDVYTQFYAIYYAMDPTLLDWSARLLTTS